MEASCWLELKLILLKFVVNKLDETIRTRFMWLKVMFIGGLY
jgi:hypothetical protein